MRIQGFQFLLLAGLLLAGDLAASGAPPRSDRRPAGNRKYVRLSQWARAHEFSVRWLEHDKTLQLTNRRASLVFTVDPRQDKRYTRINGVGVLLAFPLLYQNGAAYITQLDLEETLSPILYPPVHRPGAKIRTICLDPGHGGADPGFTAGSRAEKKYTLLLAQEVREQLRAAGFSVALTRSGDAKVALESRPELARRRGADLFVSLHFNSVARLAAQVKGIEVYCLTPEGAFSSNAGAEGDTRWCVGNGHNEKNMLLAYHVQRSLIRSLPVEDRGVHRARFQVLREATMPAILVEGGFMSHPVESRKIFDPAYRRQMARAIVQGILAYKTAVKG